MTDHRRPRSDRANAANVDRPRFRWFAVYDGQRYRRQASMRGTWGWDVVCTCGWDSRTGGATRTSVLRDIDDHLLHDHGLIAVHGKVYDRLVTP